MVTIVTRAGKGSELTHNELDANFINLNNGKADIGQNGLIAKEILPGFWMKGSIAGGDGSSEAKAVEIVGNSDGGQASAEDYLKALPGFEPGVEKILYGGGPNGFSWGPPPTGVALGNTTLTLGTSTVNSIPLSWTGVVDANGYTVQRADNALFTGAVVVFNNNALSYAESVLEPNKDYWYRVRAFGAGFNPGAWSSGTKKTAASGVITPPSPINAVTNDSADTFNWTNADGYSVVSSYEYTLNWGSSYQPLTAKPLVVGNISKAIGQVGVRVKADTGRTASATLFNAVAFTIAPVKADAPTSPITDDVNDLFNWTNNPLFTSINAYEYTLNGGTSYLPVTEKPLFVGDWNKAVGMVGVRVKAASGVIPSDTLFNTVAYTGTDGLLPINQWMSDAEGFDITSNNVIGNGQSGLNRARSRHYHQAGSETIIIATGYARLCMDDNPTVLAYSSQINFGLMINSANRKMQCTIGSVYTDVATLPGTAVPKIRFRLSATTIYWGYSLDNGATWNEPKNAPLDAGVDLYVKAEGGYLPTDGLQSISGSGLSINSSLT